MVARVTRQVKASAGGVCDLGYHVVWCPRYRRRVLAGRVAAWCEDLIRARARGRGWRMVTLEIMPDHVRLVVTAHPSHSPSRVASQFKGFISRRLRAGLRTRGPACQPYGPGRLVRRGTVRCPREPCASTPAGSTGGGGGRNGPCEARGAQHRSQGRAGLWSSLRGLRRRYLQASEQSPIYSPAKDRSTAGGGTAAGWPRRAVAAHPSAVCSGGGGSGRALGLHPHAGPYYRPVPA